MYVCNWHAIIWKYMLLSGIVKNNVANANIFNTCAFSVPGKSQRSVQRIAKVWDFLFQLHCTRVLKEPAVKLGTHSAAHLDSLHPSRCSREQAKVPPEQLTLIFISP